jgi:hypothetical protein
LIYFIELIFVRFFLQNWKNNNSAYNETKIALIK